MVKVTVFRYRPIVWDAVMGFATISVEELNRIGTKESKEFEVTLQNEPGVVSKWPQPKLKLKVIRLETSTDFALAYF
jgi:hypothetical protein